MRTGTVVKMAGKPRVAPDQMQVWQTRLSDAAREMHKLRDDAREAELTLRQVIMDAFDAGLSVTPICQATGLSLGRVYQVKRGTRR